MINDNNQGRVGKTSVTLKYCLGQFHENEESTINASYLDKELTFEGQQKRFAIWV
jgi:Ras-related protein Rab-21